MASQGKAPPHSGVGRFGGAAAAVELVWPAGGGERIKMPCSERERERRGLMLRRTDPDPSSIPYSWVPLDESLSPVFSFFFGKKELMIYVLPSS